MVQEEMSFNEKDDRRRTHDGQSPITIAHLRLRWAKNYQYAINYDQLWFNNVAFELLNILKCLKYSLSICRLHARHYLKFIGLMENIVDPENPTDQDQQFPNSPIQWEKG